MIFEFCGLIVLQRLRSFTDHHRTFAVGYIEWGCRLIYVECVFSDDPRVSPDNKGTGNIMFQKLTPRVLHRVVEKTAQLILRYYPSPEVAEEMADHIRAELKAGR